MTQAADLILTNCEVHTLAEPDETHEAVAVRDGRIVRVESAYEVDFLNGVDTERIDCGGRVVLPGFVDAHTHLPMLGRYLVHADLSGAEGPAECVERLRGVADGAEDGWILGFGYDESAWEDSRYLTRADLDGVSDDRPVAAFREDMHVASVNGVALSRHREAMPGEDVERENGEPTGVLVEEAVDAIYGAIEPDAEEMRELIEAAQERAVARGVTGVHDMVRNSQAPRVYRELDSRGELSIRVRLNYWSDHLESMEELGLRTDHGSGFVRTGAIKSYTDGSFGGRTAKLSEPYEGEDGGSGQWVVPPEELRELVERADGEGFQVSAHAIGDRAIEAVVEAFERTGHAAEARHRVEHAELLSEELIERIAEAGIVASVQPNFLKWAGEDGLYGDRLGDERRRRTNRYADLLEAGAHLAFGSDCMPLDPLLGIHHAVNAPEASQRLSVTQALRAYTSGAAYAGFDERRLGTVEPGKRADLVVLEESPWERPGSIDGIDVTTTIVDGETVYDATS
ncbi:amidohydrolase [Halalkalicoccus ordinarius]|uniref:amidohydrolase n=1 Tax=Halalkalicoccus ordinarius TaxID=3116651 RepID=UPI00300EA134